MLLKTAINGRRAPDEHPAIPITPGQLADQAAMAGAAGAGAIHVHPRDSNGQESLAADDIAATLNAIRAACPATPIGVSTGAWIVPEIARRLSFINDWKVLPDCAGVNFHEPGAVETCRLLLEKGVGFEAGIWNTEAAHLLAERLIEPMSAHSYRARTRIRRCQKSAGGNRGGFARSCWATPLARFRGIDVGVYRSFSGYVGPELQQRVQDAVAAMQYSPNSVAASLRERRSRAIGVVVPDITMGLFPAIVRRLAKRAAFTDYQLILIDSQEDPAWERERVRALIRRKIDALIVIPCRDDSPMLEDVRQSGIPTVLLDRVANGSDFDHVLLDNVAAAAEGTRHLISLGHRRILLLASDPSLRNIRERIEGYRAALADADLLGFENVVVAGRNEAEDARQALLPVLAGPGRPSALFAVTQTMTIGGSNHSGKPGWNCQKTFRCSRSTILNGSALKPFVSTVRQPTDNFADQAWAMLMARLNNDRSPTLQSEVHASLAIRAGC